jgi:hypothetical protein
MPTPGQARQSAKERVRKLKRALRKVDTKLEIMERRLDKILERDSLVQLPTFDSWLNNWDQFILEVKEMERVIVNVMIIFRLLS